MITLENMLKEICYKLQISGTQYREAEQKYSKIQKQLHAQNSPFACYNLEIFPQGSFAIGTTVKPLGRDEYDVDLVCLLNNCTTIEIPPIQLLTDLRNFLIPLYGKENIELKKRCVSINFSKNFHLDILPAIPDHIKGDTNLYVPDRKTKDWTCSNPKGYCAWFKHRSQQIMVMGAKDENLPAPATTNYQTPLQNTVQLFKRWRDIAFRGFADNYQPRSIVLTTLLANTYSGDTSVQAALSNCLSNIQKQVSTSVQPIRVLNPLNSEELFSEKWEEEPDGYFHFRTQLATFSQNWQMLKQASTLAEQKKILDEMFGEEITTIALDSLATQYAGPNSASSLHITPKGTLTTKAVAGSIAVPKHTFYGN